MERKKNAQAEILKRETTTGTVCPVAAYIGIDRGVYPPPLFSLSLACSRCLRRAQFNVLQVALNAPRITSIALVSAARTAGVGLFSSLLFSAGWIFWDIDWASGESCASGFSTRLDGDVREKFSHLRMRASTRRASPLDEATASAAQLPLSLLQLVDRHRYVTIGVIEW